MAESIRLHVRLAGNLASRANGARGDIELLLDQTIPLRDIAHQVGVEPHLVMLYAVNGTPRPELFRPDDGDTVLLVPAVSGG